MNKEHLEKYLKYQKKIIQYANKYIICENDRDDFVQETMLKIIENPERIKQSFYNHKVDYLRKYYGHDSRVKGEPKTLKQVNYINLGASVNFIKDKRTPEFNLLTSKVNEYFEKNIAAKVIYVLIHKWGFTSREIAECFGCHESYISQKIKTICREIKNPC